MQRLQHIVGSRWQVDKPTDFSPSAEYLHEEITEGFKGVNKRLDTQNSRIRSLEVSKGYALGAVGVFTFGSAIALGVANLWFN